MKIHSQNLERIIDFLITSLQIIQHKKHIYYTFFEKHLNDLKIYSTAQFDNETRIIIHQIIAL